MSMDHIKTVYVPPKRNGPKRTTYAIMTQWLSPSLNDLTSQKTMPIGNHTVGALYNNQDGQVNGSLPIHLQYTQSGGYDDAHKAYMKLRNAGGLGFGPKLPEFPQYGPPRLRNGRLGGSWRHIKNVLQAKGSRNVFVDGVQRIEDNCKLVEKEVPGGNIIQKSLKSPSPTGRPTVTWNARTPPKQKRMSRGTGSFYLEAHQGTEKGNWFLMR